MALGIALQLRSDGELVQWSADVSEVCAEVRPNVLALLSTLLRHR